MGYPIGTCVLVLVGSVGSFFWAAGPLLAQTTPVWMLLECVKSSARRLTGRREFATLYPLAGYNPFNSRVSLRLDVGRMVATKPGLLSHAR